MSSVYFIQNGEDGPIKIGVAVNVKHRLKALQTANPVELKLLATVDGNKELEQELHQRFDPTRIRFTEWFDPTPELWELIESCRAGNIPPVDDPPDTSFAGSSSSPVETAGIEPAPCFPRGYSSYIEGLIVGLDCRGLPCPECDIGAGPYLRLPQLDLAVCHAGHHFKRNQYGELFPQEELDAA